MIKVSNFYHSCDKSRTFDLIAGKNEHFVFANAIRHICSLMHKQKRHDVLLHELREYLERELTDECFSFSWQKETFITESVFKFSRFLEWLGTPEVLHANLKVVAPVNRDIVLEDAVHLVVQYANKAFGAIMINTGKTPFSANGRTVHTKSVNNLHSIVAKIALESAYPGIVISSVYLSTEADSTGNMASSFITDKTRKCNVFSHSFKEYLSVGGMNALMEHLKEVYFTPYSSSCYGCKHSSLCKLQPLARKTDVYTELDEDSSYVVPSFTDSQMEVVNHVDGPLLVCAGPGSGKTATLVGRIKSLLEKDIASDFILAITFTREAAKELQKRCETFCKDDMPTISTINALCYNILRSNSELVGEVNLLTQREKLSIIEGLLEVFPPLQGISYAVLDGNNGTLKTVERRLDKYISMQRDVEKFLETYSELSYDFIEFANHFCDILERHGYITFQEQISMCIRFLEENPDALADYQRIYRYIMVDEYQDIDAMQAKFIYMLAIHNNLVVVGDDDQAIYGFRGGSHKYMLEFQSKFPGAKKVILKENFRSTKALVDAAKDMISSNANRIEKAIESTREQGISPIYREGLTGSDVDTVVAEVLSEGFTYADIAVLSQKNATLEALQRDMKTPSVLEKSYLVDEPLFVGVLNAYKCIKSGYGNNRAMLFLCLLFGVEIPYFENSLYESVKQLGSQESASLLAFLSKLEQVKACGPLEYIQTVAFELGLEHSSALLKLSEFVNDSHIKTLDALEEALGFMVRFEDDTKVDVSNTSEVLLITNHESKGREFPVVILIDESGATTEEQRRVLYVAMTRAKDRLYILRK